MKLDLETMLKAEGIEFEKEYKFYDKRKFRADYRIKNTDILIEIEGGTWAKGRHITGTGYRNDCIKYNLAQRCGFILLRYTTDMVRDMQFKIIDEIKELMI